MIKKELSEKKQDLEALLEQLNPTYTPLIGKPINWDEVTEEDLMFEESNQKPDSNFFAKIFQFFKPPERKDIGPLTRQYRKQSRERLFSVLWHLRD